MTMLGKSEICKYDQNTKHVIKKHRESIKLVQNSTVKL